MVFRYEKKKIVDPYFTLCSNFHRLKMTYIKQIFKTFRKTVYKKMFVINPGKDSLNKTYKNTNHSGKIVIHSITLN